jgi:hypothetical protein
MLHIKGFNSFPVPQKLMLTSSAQPQYTLLSHIYIMHLCMTITINYMGKSNCKPIVRNREVALATIAIMNF